MAETSMDEDAPGVSLWDKFKKQLDEELVPDQVAEMRYLMKDKINSEVFPHLKTPSDLLTFLENNMAGDEAWTIVEHVFRITNDHFEFENPSIAAIVNKYRQTRARFTCSTFIGRKNDVQQVLSYFNKYDFKGIWIHGFGGLGKTALAREVCARLSTEMDVTHVDMKHITSALDFVRQILTFVVKVNAPSSNLETLIEMIVLPGNGKQCILLDNIEDVYLNNQSDTIKVFNRCVKVSSPMIKWIITCRLSPDHELKPKLDKWVAVIELKPLDEIYSSQLLKLRAKPKNVPHDLVLTIVKQTNGNPLAIGLVGAAIKQETCGASSYLISGSMETAKMEDVLSFTYGSLNEFTQHKLLELSVVGTSEFDINIASAILETKFDETVMIMMELTNRHVIQRVEWAAIRNQDSKSQAELEYCLHPLLLRYLENKHTENSINRAQLNFCSYIFQKIENTVNKQMGFDVNYPMVRKVILDSAGVYKSMLQVLAKQRFTKDNSLPVDRCIYLSKVAETVQLSPMDKSRLYSNIISNSSEHAALFWHIERMATFIDLKQFQDAHDILIDIESSVTNNDGHVDDFTFGSFWYHKGRYLRMTNKFQDALDCFDRAMGNFRSCHYVAGVAQTQNAKGNVYFDKCEYENAKDAHEQARGTLKDLVINDHPDLSTYDFNVGTVCLAIAEQKLRINHKMGDEVKEYYQKALNMFEESLKRDMAMGMTKSTQYATKLDNTAWCHYRLGNIEEAISTMKEYVEANTSLFPNRKTLTANYRTGKSFMDWCFGTPKYGKEIIRRLAKEAENYFSKVKQILRDFPSSDLSDTDKADFIKYYKKLSGNFSRERMKSAERFCQRYEQGKLCTNDSSTSSSESSSISSDTSESLSDEAMQEGEGISLEQWTGIPFAESEKLESAQFVSNLFTQVDSIQKVGKRHHSSSDSEE